MPFDVCDKTNKKAIFVDLKSELSDAEAYRRARRQDILLTKHGFTVFRFLAEDVCERLNFVLEELHFDKA